MSLTDLPTPPPPRAGLNLGKATLKAAFGAAVAIGVLGAGQAQALTITLFNEFRVGGSTYRSYTADAVISWNTARNYALGLPGGNYDLTSINDAAENAAIFAQIDNAQMWSGGQGAGPWIGLYQPPSSPEPGGNWLWLDGTSLISNAFSNWAPGQPDNSWGPEFEAYGHFWQRINYPGQWNDARGSGAEGNRSFVTECKNDAAICTPPVPGPLPVLGAAAAFGFSRKLRKRIKTTKAVGASFTAS